jgi:sulfate transport system permease protein
VAEILQPPAVPVDARPSTDGSAGDGFPAAAVPAVRPRRQGGATRWLLRLVAVGYLTLLVALPVGLIFWRTFEHGIGPVWDALTQSDTVHAFQVTLIVAGCAVVINTAFGLTASLLLVRHDFPGKSVLDKLIDLPLAVSPVVVGLALILVYGRNTGVGSWLGHHGFNVIFALPGMVLATSFVSLPLMVRELVPVLEEVGDEQEQAAATLGASPLQTFRRVTLPAIRWGLAYGVVLTLARSLGEYGAVAVVSGHIVGQTQTATLLVEQSFDNFEQGQAYAVAFALAAVAIVALLAMSLLRARAERMSEKEEAR